MIKSEEGLRLFPYADTQGFTTIGWGRNLDGRGISPLEAQMFFDNDINLVVNQLSEYDFYKFAPENIQSALINMCFNLGLPKLLNFKRMISALNKKNYNLAAREALDSLWARQVPNRAKRIAVLMREGFGDA